MASYGEKRDTGHSGDRLSNLPDCILFLIISLLDMKSVVRTGVLSKRWKDLWLYTPNLFFLKYGDDHDMSFIKFLERSLVLHLASKIHSFRFLFFYKEAIHGSYVDGWIRYAFLRNVQELDLDFRGECERPDFIEDLYLVPPWVFKCDKLVSLRLNLCNIPNVPSNYICFHSLRKLCLSWVSLADFFIEGMLVASPLLEELEILDCYILSGCFRMYFTMTNQLLKRLKVDTCYCMGGFEIEAPNLEHLELHDNVFYLDSDDESYSLKKMFSLRYVYLDFDFDELHTEPVHRLLLNLLEDVRHTEVLRLSHRCIQVMSVPALSDLLSYMPKTKCLVLETGLHTSEVPGIAHLLYCCRNLERLVIELGPVSHLQFRWKTMKKFDFDEEEYWESLTFAFPCLVHHLKAIKISEHLLDEQWFGPNVASHARYLELQDRKIMLVSFLFKNAVLLEKMDVHVCRKPCFLNAQESLLPKLMAVSETYSAKVSLFYK